MRWEGAYWFRDVASGCSKFSDDFFVCNSGISKFFAKALPLIFDVSAADENSHNRTVYMVCGWSVNT